MSQEDIHQTEGIDLSLDEIIKKNITNSQSNFNKHQSASPSNNHSHKSQITFNFNFFKNINIKLIRMSDQGNWPEKKGMRGGRYFTQRGRSRGSNGSGRGNRMNMNNRRMNNHRWRGGENNNMSQQMSWKENNHRFYTKDNYTPKIENPLDEDVCITKRVIFYK